MTMNDQTTEVADTRKTQAARAKQAIHEATSQAKQAANSVADDVEQTVDAAVDGATPAAAWVAENMKRLLLASIGAVAITVDEAQSFVSRLVDRGELAQKDAEKVMAQVRSQVRMPAARAGGAASGVNAQVEKVGAQVEQGVEELLNRLNIPSKRDIDDLSARIAQLSARVEELRRQ